MMTILEALEKWLATIAPGQDAKHNLEALNKASVALGGPGKFKSVGPAWDDVLSRYQGGGGGDYTPYDGEYEVTPSTEDQTLATKDKGLDDNVTVKAVTAAIDENIKAENIKQGVTILGIDGSYEGETPESFGGPYEVTPSTVGQTLHTANLMMDEDVKVGAVSATIDENIRPENIKKDIQILGVMGTLEGGEDVPAYEGSYSVTPDTASQTLLTAGKKMEQNLEIEGISPVDSKQNVFAAYTVDPNTTALTPVAEPEHGGLSVDSENNAIFLFDIEGNECPPGTFTEVSGSTGLMIFADKHAAAPYWHSGSHDLPVSGADFEKAMESQEQAGGFQVNIQSSFLKPENIKQGVSIFGVAGSYAPESTVKPIALSRIGVVDNAQFAAYFNGKYYLFQGDRLFTSTDGISFTYDSNYNAAYEETGGSNRAGGEFIHGVFTFAGMLVAVVGSQNGSNFPHETWVQFLYTEDGTTWQLGETAVQQVINSASEVEDVAVGASATHLIVYYRYADSAKILFYAAPDVSPLEFTFQQATAGITASTGSEYAEEGTVKICRWDNSGDVLLTWQNDSNAWYFGKVSIAANDVSSAPVSTKAFTPEQVTCLQYVEVSNAVAVGLSTGSWIALTALEEESQPGTATPIFTGSSVLALAFGGEGNGIAGGVGGAMAFCSAGGAWKTFSPINGGSNLVSAAYGNNVFIVAGEGEEASISAQV